LSTRATSSCGHRGVDVVLKAAAGKVVAYAADVIDPRTYVGWSVTLTGMAQMIDSPAEMERFFADSPGNLAA
jgi:starvation-inducible outer membrane lipoprotein